MKTVAPSLHDKLNTLINSMSYEMIGAELLSQGGQQLLRIYIDQIDPSKGITITDCSRVSRQVSAMLDVEDPIAGKYTLEVSSPGIDRPLFNLDHFRKFVGSRLKIRLNSPFNQRRQYKGLLQQVEGEDIYLLLEDTKEVIKLPFSSIDKANLVGDVRL